MKFDSIFEESNALCMRTKESITIEIELHFSYSLKKKKKEITAANLQSNVFFFTQNNNDWIKV